MLPQTGTGEKSQTIGSAARAEQRGREWSSRRIGERESGNETREAGEGCQMVVAFPWPLVVGSGR